MIRRSLSAAILAVAIGSGASAARGDVEQKATGAFLLTLFRALPSAWVPEQALEVHATGVVSASASNLPSGALIRLTFPFPGGDRVGVLRIDLSAPSMGRIYAADSSDLALDYYEVGPSGPEFRVDRVDGTVEVVSWSQFPQIAFALRFESWGVDGVGGTEDDQARELTDGFAGVVVTESVPPVTQPVGSSAAGGVEVIWGDPWGPTTSSTSSSGSDGGCTLDEDDDEESGCGGDGSGGEDEGSGGGCGGDSDSTDSSDSESGGCGGDDDDGACESDAQASPRARPVKGAGRLVPRAGNLVAFLLLLAAVHWVRRRGTRGAVASPVEGRAEAPLP